MKAPFKKPFSLDSPFQHRSSNSQQRLVLLTHPFIILDSKNLNDKKYSEKTTTPEGFFSA